MTYYTFFHPTGVEVNVCCFKRESGRPTEVTEAVEHTERPRVLNLHAAEAQQSNGDDNGEVAESASNIKSKSRLSVSRWSKAKLECFINTT